LLGILDDGTKEGVLIVCILDSLDDRGVDIRGRKSVQLLLNIGVRVARERIGTSVGDSRDIVNVKVKIAKEIQPPYLPLRQVTLCLPMDERSMI
jgi:hypothetical protein